jgi:UDPglucose 6-dehydrogenase
MLATRISFMNELANLAERLGADIEEVRKGIGSDPRIGYQFLYAGIGYGGSCFPKDVKALIHTAAEAGAKLPVLDAVERVNTEQKRVLAAKILKRFGKLAGRRIAVWGLAFKPNTDDMREAPSRVLIEELLANGASVSAYDPIAMPAAKIALADLKGVTYADSPLAALDGADALAVVTEWKEFRSPDFQAIRARLKTPAIFDGRNLYDPEEIKRAGLEYYPVGRAVARRDG